MGGLLLSQAQALPNAHPLSFIRPHTDYRIESFMVTAVSAIAEPTSLALLGFGSVLMVTRRRRRQQVANCDNSKTFTLQKVHLPGAFLLFEKAFTQFAAWSIFNSLEVNRNYNLNAVESSAD